MMQNLDDTDREDLALIQKTEDVMPVIEKELKK